MSLKEGFASTVLQVYPIWNKNWEARMVPIAPHGPHAPPGSDSPEPSTFGSGANTHSGNKHEIVAGHAMAICQAAGLSLCARAFLPKLVNKLWSFNIDTKDPFNKKEARPKELRPFK